MKLPTEGEKPAWWNNGGIKMDLSNGRFPTVARPELPAFRFYLGERGVRQLSVFRSLGNIHWSVGWEISYSDGIPHSPHVEGWVLMNNQEYAAAFGLSDRLPNDQASLKFADRYRATTGSIGKFIRRGDFLNVSGPGTGEAVDANLSVLLTPEIKSVALRVLTDYLAKRTGQEISDAIAIVEAPMRLR